MPDEKTIAPIATETRGADPQREAALTAPTIFADKLMDAFNVEKTKLKEVKAPDNRPPQNFDRDVDPAKQPVYDPKGMLAATAKLLGKEAPKVAAANTEPVTKVADKGTEDYPENAASPEAKNSWQKLKADRDEKLKALTERETELLELKKRFDPAAYDKAVKENEELTREIRKLDVERHPRFKETYDKPIASAVASAKRILPAEYHADAEKWLTQPDSPQRDKVIQEITEQLPVHKQASFVRYVEDAAIALEKRTTALQGESEFVTKYNADQKAQQEAARVQADAQARNVFKTVLTKSFADNPLFNTSDDASREANEKRIARAESLLFGNNPPEALAEAVLYAEYGRDVQPLLVQAYDEIQRLTALVDKQAGKSVSNPSSSRGVGGNVPSDNQDFVDMIVAKANEQLRR